MASIFLLPVFCPFLPFFRFRFPFLPGRFLLRLRYQSFTVCIRVVEQLVEHIGRKSLAQTRAIKHCLIGMIYESDAVQTSFGIEIGRASCRERV